MKRTLLLAVLAAWLWTPCVGAQESSEARRLEDPQWVLVVNVQYEPGKRDEALRIVREHFAPAGHKAGIAGPELLIHETGRWDVSWVWHLREGITQLDWETHPNDVKWMGALAEQEGGMEAALEILGQYMDLMEDFDRILMRKVAWIEPPAEAMEEDAGRKRRRRN